MMKFPSAVGGGTVPSGNSVAWTNPGAWGSRMGNCEGDGRGGTAGAGAAAGGVGWAMGVWAVAEAAARIIRNEMLRKRDTGLSSKQCS